MQESAGTGWKNSGDFPPGDAGCGIEINDMVDRIKYFARGRIKLHLDGLSAPVYANTNKRSFRTPTCGELMSREIGGLMRAKGLIRWNGRPPTFTLRQISPSEFDVRLLRRG
jgi:hypothetical protein